MGGTGSGSSDSSVVSKEETLVEQDNHNNDNFEVSDDSELELGLGLSLGVANNSKNHKQIPRILTSKDLPSPPSASSCSSLGLRTPSSAKTNNVSVGSKRAASPTAVRYNFFLFSHLLMFFYCILNIGYFCLLIILCSFLFFGV